MTNKFNKEDLQNSDDSGAKFVGDFVSMLDIDVDCCCHRCIEANDIRAPHMPQFLLNSCMMILCPICGNKRCPHASDHNLECTGSNDVGQPGSIYN